MKSHLLISVAVIAGLGAAGCSGSDVADQRTGTRAAPASSAVVAISSAPRPMGVTTMSAPVVAGTATLVTPAVVSVGSSTATVTRADSLPATSSAVAPHLPATLTALLPKSASVLAAQQASLQDNQSVQWVVVYREPGSAGSQASYPPPSTHLAILQHAPAGWSVAKSIDQGFAVGAHLQILPINGRQSVFLQYGTGAHAAGLLVVRYDGVLDYAVVFDATSDAGLVARDLNGDGTPEVVRTWSPYCGSFVASPAITIVYAWQHGRYVDATGSFPAVIARDTARFQAAVTRPGANWKPADLACLHASLGFLAAEAGNTAAAATEDRAAHQADSTYDTNRIARLATGDPLATATPAAGPRL